MLNDSTYELSNRVPFLLALEEMLNEEYRQFTALVKAGKSRDARLKLQNIVLINQASELSKSFEALELGSFESFESIDP